jgi:tetratricopeptide (TPR) repeat protein
MAPFSRNASFVGRENPIATLEDEVLGSGSMRKIAICGLGGIGKTQIALELAYRVRDRDPEMSVFWIQCTSYESVEQAYMNLAQLIGLAHVNTAAVKEQVKAYLSHESSGKWLLVYDNADDMEMWMKGTAAGPPLKRLLPQNEAGHIVFTSRNSKLAVKLVSSNVIRIPDMDEDTALRMLRKLLIRKDLLEDRVAVATLLEQLCYLPLAISQAAAYINENDITALEDYLCLLAAQEEDVVNVLTEDFEDDGRYTDIQNPVATTWLVSFSQIQSSDPLAVEYLSFMACINPRNIPQSLLLSRVSDKKETEALGILKAYSFVSEEPKTKDLTLHRLVYLATRTWMKKDGTFRMWTHRTIERIDARCAVAGYDERDLWRRYLPHILSLIENKEVGSVRFEYGSLLQNVGYWLRSDGRYGQAKALCSQVLEDRQKYLGMDHGDTLVALHDLGSVLRELGDYSEARHILEQALDRQIEVLGGEHPDTLMTLRTLGVVLSHLGYCERARSVQHQALQGSIETLGPGDLRTLECATGLASALFGGGHYQLAHDMYRVAVDGYVKELGLLHERTLYAVVNCGMALWRLCKLDQAEQMFREVFEIANETYGPEHPLTMKSRENLAYIYVEQEKFGEADELLERALDASKRVLGAEHPETLIIIDQRGIVLRKQGRHDEAKALHRQAIYASIKHLGGASPLTILFFGNLAVTHWEQGELQEAEELQLGVWESNKQQLGVDHPTTLRSMQNLAFTWESLGKRCEAIDLTTECLELRTKILGPEHDDTVDSRTILSRWQGIENGAVVAEPATALDCDGQVNFERDDDDNPVSIPVDSKANPAAAIGEISNTFRIQMPTEA